MNASGALEAQVGGAEVGAADSPTRDDREPAARGLRGQVGGAVVVDAADQEPVGVDPVEEVGEGRAVGLLGPPVVEVVGLDVGDDRGVRRVDEEGAVALVGLGDEQVAAAVVGVARRSRSSIAADGVRRVGAGRRAARRSAARWWWSCRGCRRPRPPAGRPSPTARPAERGSIRRPRGAGLDVPRGCPRGRRWRRPRCRRRRRARRRGRGGTGRRARAVPAGPGCRWSSLPVTAMPRASHDPGDARTGRRRRCRRSGRGRAGRRGRSRRGRGPSPAPLPRRRRPRSGPACRRRRAGSAPTRPRPSCRAGRCRWPGRARSRATHSEVSAASATSRPPPASTTGRALCVLLAVADRQRHEDRRQRRRRRPR